MTETTMLDLDLEVEALEMLDGEEAQQLLVDQCWLTCRILSSVCRTSGNTE
jgi:hypothetical protein